MSAMSNLSLPTSSGATVLDVLSTYQGAQNSMTLSDGKLMRMRKLACDIFAATNVKGYIECNVTKLLSLYLTVTVTVSVS